MVFLKGFPLQGVVMDGVGPLGVDRGLFAPIERRTGGGVIQHPRALYVGQCQTGAAQIRLGHLQQCLFFDHRHHLHHLH
ncbi:hypothetical protein ACSDBR_10020 [Acidithiobacillus ferriphilus]|uniref:hypothetical protein n=1 Tax=Acidithiobacillus ferriphilus TaxID=1689834 RepID=UPI003F515B52